MADSPPVRSVVVPRLYLYPFALVTCLFALWGFANDVTNPLVKAFRDIFLISNAQSSLVQTAFYGGYATMAIPAALVIRMLSFKAGILIGLALFATGALLFIPASMHQQFQLFLVAIYVLTFGLAFIETSSYPCILSMGPEETGTQRLNLAAAFNPIGSLSGMVLVGALILPQLKVEEFRAGQIAAHPEYAKLLPSETDSRISSALEEFRRAEPAEHAALQAEDLSLIQWPYVGLAAVAIMLMVLFACSKMPAGEQMQAPLSFLVTLRCLLTYRYLGGVVAQAFYVGVQIMCWTFIIHYGMTLLGMTAAEAQGYNILAMAIYLACRFLGTLSLRFISPPMLLSVCAVGGMIFAGGAVQLEGMPGIYAVVAISACMSIMFPTIYGIAMRGLSTEATQLGAAGQTFAIVGGAVMPFLQAMIIDLGSVQVLGQTMDAVRASFLLPLGCFVVIALYGMSILFTSRTNRPQTPSTIA